MELWSLLSNNSWKLQASYLLLKSFNWGHWGLHLGWSACRAGKLPLSYGVSLLFFFLSSAFLKVIDFVIWDILETSLKALVKVCVLFLATARNGGLSSGKQEIHHNLHKSFSCTLLVFVLSKKKKRKLPAPHIFPILCQFTEESSSDNVCCSNRGRHWIFTILYRPFPSSLLSASLAVSGESECTTERAINVPHKNEGQVLICIQKLRTAPSGFLHADDLWAFWSHGHNILLSPQHPK